MELLEPGVGLLLWQILIVASGILFVVSWTVIIKTDTLDTRGRLTWLVGTCLLPLIGPLIYLTKYLTSKKSTNKDQPTTGNL